MIVAQVMAGAAFGGAELFFERLCGGLHAAGDTVVPVIRRDAARAGRLRAAGLSPREVRFGLLGRFAISRVLQQARPASVVAWMGRAAAVVPRGPWALLGRLGGYYDLKRFGRCEHLIGNTADIVHWIVRQGWPATRVHHVPNFVPDLLGVAPTSRAALGVPADATLLLALGRLHEAKGFDVLIDALPGLPGAHVVIAGEGPARTALTRRAAALGMAGRVHLPGWRGDTGALLACCDVLVCPSRHEPLGNVVLEAWSAGRPVVAAAALGPAALIRHGADGMLVPTGDAAALGRAVAQVLEASGLAAALAGRGRERYLAGFTEAAVVAEWRGLLARVAR